MEIIEPTSYDSPVTEDLKKQGAGIHHICFRVENIDEALAEIKEKGIRTIFGESPINGSRGTRVIVLHPEDTNNIIIELAEMSR